MPAPSSPDHSLTFGPYRLVPAQRLLLKDGQPVRLGSRALDILIALVRRAGQVVDKQQLMATVWRDAVVDEGSLRVQMAALRKALGESSPGQAYIANIPLRGYSFVAPVQAHEAASPWGAADEPAPSPAAPTAAAVPPPPAAPALPVLPIRPVGRDELCATLAEQVTQRRLVTLVGPAGIGKTTLALTVAHAVVDAFRDGVHFVDFVPLAGGDAVPATIGAALGIALAPDDPATGLVAHLAPRHALLVLDNCEHVADATALIVERLLTEAPGLHVLATCREPLRVQGERVQRIRPLEVPAVVRGLSAEDATAYPAIALLVERASASVDGFQLRDDEVEMAASICRRLDGIPLAIELVATRVSMFSLRELAARLDDRMALLTQGRRAALPRHRTLLAALEWSHELLTPAEQVVLRRVAVFRESFTIASAGIIAADEQLPAHEVFDAVLNLVNKSLASSDDSGETTMFRLLETTRSFAARKLMETHEAAAIARRHALHTRDVALMSEERLRTMEPAAWVQRFAARIDDVRAAIQWAAGAPEEGLLGVEIVTATAPL